jgi:hypothetical protein
MCVRATDIHERLADRLLDTDHTATDDTDDQDTDTVAGPDTDGDDEVIEDTNDG